VLKLGCAIVGCGTVGGGTAALVSARRESIKQRFGVDLELRHLIDINHDNVKELGLPETLFRTELSDALNDPETQVIIELVGGTGFAKTIFEKAFSAGKHIITANKKLLAEMGYELFAMARKNGVTLGWEASCAGSIPIVELLGPAFGGSRITQIQGILNGTSNFILTKMINENTPYEEALKEAQSLGYAEANPELDVSGMDSAHKLTLLAGLAFNNTFHLEDITVLGIKDIPLEDVKAGTEMGLALKLLATAEMRTEGPAIRVGPAFLEKDHPLASVSGVFNGITILGSAFGLQTFIGRGAGAFPTANAVVSDLIQLALGISLKHQLQCEYLPGSAPVADPIQDGQVLRRWLVILPLSKGEHPQLSLAQAGLGLISIQKKHTDQGDFDLIITEPASLFTLQTVLGPSARCYPIYRTPREILRADF